MDRVVIGMAIALGAIAVFLILAVLPVGLSETTVNVGIKNTFDDLFPDDKAFKTKYNHTKIPDLYIIVKSTGKAYAGEEGSYCWEGICGDSVRIVPENTIVLDKGTEIDFMIINYKQPEIFDASLTSEDPLLQPKCVTNNATGEIRCGAPEGVELPELTKLDSDFKYKVDVPSGFYMISVGVSWVAEGYNTGRDASYYYRVQVR